MTWSKDLIENITDIGELEAKLRFDRRLTQQMRELCEKFPMSVTRYYLSLIDWSDTDDPIRRMSIPTFLETDMSGEFDTSDEESNTVCQGVQHKYTESALILTTNRCFMYCRHCFRKRLVGRSDEEIAGNLESVVNYIREHTELTNVILSGGDAFTLPTCIIKHYLDALSRMKHLDLIRIATRSPAVYPMRIYMDEDLLACLKKYSRKKQLYVVTQFNHPREITPEATAAIRALLDCGVVVKNQTVLLKGVNDSPGVLGSLLRKLTACGTVPYYIFQCRPVSGVKNIFQVPFSEGYDIVEGAKAMQSGQGKCFKYCMSHPKGKIEIIGKLNDGSMVFKFHQAKNNRDCGRAFIKKLSKDAAWLPDEL